MNKKIIEDNSVNDFVYGGGAAMINICLIYPFYKTIFFQQLDNLTWHQSVIRLINEGPNDVYRGILPPLIQTAATRSIMFGGYSRTRTLIDNNQLSLNSSSKIVISSVTAGFMEAILMPLERVQVLLQNKTYNDRFKDTYHTFKVLINTHGFRELYRGLGTVMLRNCIGNSIYFNVCDRYLYHRDMIDVAKSNTVLYNFLNFIIGGSLGAGIGLLIFPLNVIKTRQQSVVGGHYCSGLITLIKIFTERGKSPLQLYRGAPANCVRSLVSWGIITMTYEWLKMNSFIKIML